MRVWIDIGAPDAARVHRAGKVAARVVVYTHKDPDQLMRQWSGERIHRLEELELYSVPASLLGPLVERLSRRMAFALSVSGKDLYITMDDGSIEGTIERHALAVGG
jgi:uncharacterized protein YaeQ